MEDGTVLDGIGFGYPTKVVGEVVFNTGMVGYTEALTDPSYRGQMLTLTYPMVGNYGVPSYNIRDEYNIPKYFEAEHIQPKALIIHELSPIASHWSCSKTLDEWLYEERIPGIHGIDTRSLTKKLRVNGVMMGALKVSKDRIDEGELFEELKKNARYDEINFVPEVSVKEAKEYGINDDVIVLIDTGVKYSIIRNLLRLNYKVVRLPYNATIDDIRRYKPKGVLLSNGPGDPKLCNETIKLSKELFDEGLPILGICLGNQIMALAANADTYKLKYGHRGQNKPCIDNKGRAYVTSQNHGYCVDPKKLESTEFEIWFKNADDKTVEGIIHKEEPYIAVQFHPEASPGPYDCMFVFEAFDKLIRGEKIG
ncbi:MAG: carbamoyl-phosphate synthase small chain [Candidatus Nitrosocaldaceae archaeon]|nr:MAG: carbamoyl-phosphate synthase small chain [Candidatus Nitrosocaldaceae archaeon]GIU72473.1 MAG: carbamoyl-phosphate synthase small chain [Candidatus Nitrosocaldaceae archaeon]